MELRQYLTLGLKWWWLLLLAAGLAAATSYAVSQRQAQVYQAVTTIIVGQSMQATDLNTQDILTSERLARTYADMARRQPVLQAVIGTLRLPDTWLELKERVTVSPVRDTQLLEISVEAGSPEEARVTADELAHQLILLSPTALENQQGNEQGQLVRQQLESLQTKIQAGQERLKTLETAMNGSLATDKVQELQGEITKLEQLMAQWETNFNQLLIFVAGDKSPNYLAVVEPAQGSAQPVRPKTQQNTLLGGVVGLLLALGIVFLLEYLDDTLKSKNDLSELVGLTPLGEISRIKGKDYPDKLIAVGDLFTPVGEAYRIIRSNIQFAAVDRPLKSIMVTSPTPNEGKSITVANLGVVMAQAGLKTVIVDADLRRPVQQHIFQISVPGGLTDLLCSPSDAPLSYLRKTNVENLSIITSGALPPNPSELLGSQRMSQLLADLTGLVDLIIYDSPPVLLVADAAVLATKVDGVILVTHAGKTRLGAVKQAVVNLQQAGANLLGGVLNQVKSRRGGYYYHHYYYSPNGHKTKERPPAAKPQPRPRWFTLFK